MSHAIGIDLGTSNCALALAGEGLDILPVTQILGPQSVGERNLLPSAVFLPAAGASPSASLPWTGEGTGIFAGTHARDLGALQPERLIVSAKSWLCNPHIDRRAAVLPWQSSVVPEKLSPVEVSRVLLAHLLSNLRHHHSSVDGPNVVVTVPASFDEVARVLTQEAARQAGWGQVTLLEEPQAAFYAWLENNAVSWRSQVGEGDLVLVCDVGGGTADFSLIAVGKRDGDLDLERVAVGDHLLLGGDNMDLALAHDVARDMEEVALDEWQFLSLLHAVRSAKEALFSRPDLGEVPIAIPSRSSRLLASSIAATLRRDRLEAVLVEGFFPMVEPDAVPTVRRAGGLRESGLPYAADAAVTRHLARFLQRARSATGVSAMPTRVLFNGGVFHANILRQRVLDQLAAWAGHPVRELEGGNPDHAVALGAAAYARLCQSGRGLRIKSGTARSYYLGLESSAPAVPGRSAPVKGLCIAPKGLEEGSHVDLPGQEFLLYTGEPCEFRFFQSAARPLDQTGDVLPTVNDLEESALLTVCIPPPAGHSPGEEIPVHLQSGLTELGNLELHFSHPPSGERWKMEFRARLE